MLKKVSLCRPRLCHSPLNFCKSFVGKFNFYWSFVARNRPNSIHFLLMSCAFWISSNSDSANPNFGYKPEETHPSSQPASSLARAPSFWSGGHTFGSCVERLGALTEMERHSGEVFYSGDPEVIISCLTCSTQSVWLCLHNSRSLARH